MCRQVKKWVRSLSSADLRAYIDEDKPTEKTSVTKVWRLLADLCHFNPTTVSAVMLASNHSLYFILLEIYLLFFYVLSTSKVISG